MTVIDEPGEDCKVQEVLREHSLTQKGSNPALCGCGAKTRLIQNK
jgi:hypothetical protein